MNINNIKIRNAKIKDIEKILEIEHNSFDKNICEDRQVFIDRIETFNEGFLVAEYENEIELDVAGGDDISDFHILLCKTVGRLLDVLQVAVDLPPSRFVI